MKTRPYITLPLVCAFLLVGAATLNAQATRTWVSGVGDDVNPCSRTAPCKTFAGAISKTAAGGEISVLDPGGFGAVTITKAITINGTGTLAGILSAGTNGVIVNAGVNDTIILRDISINGAGTGINGVRFLAGKTLIVDHCWIYGMTTRGIDLSKTTDGNLNIINTNISNNAGDALGVSTTAGLARVMIQNSFFSGSANGIHALQNSRISAVGCVISGNTGAGVFAEGTGGVAVANIGKSEISNNGGAGVQAGGGGSTALSIVRISDSELHQNGGTAALVSTNGEVDSWANNRIFGNGVDGCPGCQIKSSN